MTDTTIPAEPEPCEYCGAKDWHCYRCDVPLTATGAEYQLCPGCLSGRGGRRRDTGAAVQAGVSCGSASQSKGLPGRTREEWLELWSAHAAELRRRFEAHGEDEW